MFQESQVNNFTVDGSAADHVNDEQQQDGQWVETISFAGKEIEIDYEAMGPYIGQFVSAIVLLLAILMPSGFSSAYGITTACIAIVSSLLGLYLLYNVEMGEKHLANIKFVGDITIKGLNASFLFIWWIIATGILTFRGPFLVTGNGYFATWAGFLLSVLGLSNHSKALKNSLKAEFVSKNRLLLASVVLIFSLLNFLGQGAGEVVYALVVGILTFCTVLFHRFPFVDDLSRRFPVFPVLAVLWFVSTILVTFRYPFAKTGNGFFSSWGGLFYCVKTALEIKQATEEQSHQEQNAQVEAVKSVQEEMELQEENTENP